MLGRELLPAVEDEVQRGAVRLQQHVGYFDRRLQFGMLAFEPRILIASEIVPRPTVEATVLDVCDVVGDEIVTEVVALVRADPQLTGRGVDREPGRVPDAAGVDASP